MQRRNDEILAGFSISNFVCQNEAKWNTTTRSSYSRSLCELYEFMGVHGPPDLASLQQWVEQLKEKGYGGRSINLRISAANNYFRWCGRPDLLMHHQHTDAVSQSPEMTRSEYLRLLCTARAMGKRRLYLLIKLFATTDLPLQCLEQITAEVIRAGEGTLEFREGSVQFHCPEGLRQELLDYMADNGIVRGPVFLTRGGQAVNRSNLCREMQELCRKAGIPEQKGNPRSLRKLYQSTQSELRSGLERMMQQAYEQLLQAEQASAGWKEGA